VNPTELNGLAEAEQAVREGYIKLHALEARCEIQRAELEGLLTTLEALAGRCTHPGCFLAVLSDGASVGLCPKHLAD
jgi:hypothetical protein